MICSLGVSNSLEAISSLSHSVVFLYFLALITEEGFFISPCYFWNSAFRCLYLSFSPLPFSSLLFTAICKVSSDNHFAFLHFFFLGKKSTLPPTYETHLTWQNCVHGKTNVNYSLWLSLFFACIVWHVFIRKEKSWEFLLSDTDTSVTSLPPWWGCPAMFIPCLAHHCITWHANSSLTLSLSAFQPRLALVSFLAAVIIWK